MPIIFTPCLVRHVTRCPSAASQRRAGRLPDVADLLVLTVCWHCALHWVSDRGLPGAGLWLIRKVRLQRGRNEYDHLLWNLLRRRGPPNHPPRDRRLRQWHPHHLRGVQRLDARRERAERHRAGDLCLLPGIRRARTEQRNFDHHGRLWELHAFWRAGGLAAVVHLHMRRLGGGHDVLFRRGLQDGDDCVAPVPHPGELYLLQGRQRRCVCLFLLVAHGREQL